MKQLISQSDSKRSIRLLFIESSLTSFTLFMPIMYLLYTNAGLNQFQIGLVSFVFAITMLFAQIPTGYLADKFSRKISNFSGDVFIAIGILLYALSGSFWLFALAEIVFGIGLSLTSGADAALLREHAKNAGMDYKKLAANLASVSFVAQGFGAIAGGFIGHYNIRWPLFVQFGIFVIAALFSLSIQDIGVKRESKKHPFTDAYEITKYCLHGHKRLAWRMFLTASTNVSTFLIVWFLTPIFLRAGVKISFHGVLFALISVAAIFGSRFASKYKDVRLTSSLLISALGYFILSLSINIYTLSFFLLTSFARGFSRARSSPYVQEVVPDDIQATVLSVNAMIFKVFSGTLVVLINYIGNFELRYGLFASFVISIGFWAFFRANEHKYI